jgi:hypothetical protein
MGMGAVVGVEALRYGSQREVQVFKVHKFGELHVKAWLKRKNEMNRLVLGGKTEFLKDEDRDGDGDERSMKAGSDSYGGAFGKKGKKSWKDRSYERAKVEHMLVAIRRQVNINLRESKVSGLQVRSLIH